MTFRSRLQAVLIALIVIVETATIVAILGAIRTHIVSQSTAQLEAGARVLENAIDNRSRELRTSVGVLAADFGFKRAVASGSEPTIQSALLNHGARVAAQISLFINLDGHAVASTDLPAEQLDATIARFQSRLAEANGGSSFDVFTMIDGRVVQLVVSPVRAPSRIGWVAVGFELDESFVTNIESLTNLTTSVVLASSSGSDILLSRIKSSASDVLTRAASTAADLRDNRPTAIESDTYLALAQPLAPMSDATLVVVLSKSLDEVLGAYQSVRVQLLVIFALAVVASIFVARVLATRISKPLRNLAGAADRISRGDYGSLVSETGSAELSRLSTAFNRMTTAIHEREQRIVFQTQHDALTGLPNRFQLTAKLERAIQRAKDQSGRFTLLTINPKNIKSINDTLGYGVGNSVLIALGSRLQESAREHDTVARIGGDEFAVMLGGTPVAKAVQVAQRLQDALARQIPLAEVALAVESSIGIVGYPEHGGDAEVLIRRCNIAMNSARALDSDRLVVYQDGQDEEHLRRLSLAGDLRTAIEEKTLRVAFQPKIDAATDRVAGVEALLRWIHPELGFVSPEEFVPLAEQAGLIGGLTDFVIEVVTSQLEDWKQAGLELTAAINVSAVDILDTDLPDRIQRRLDEHHLSPATLILEVTESAVVEDAVVACGVMQRLRDKGIRLAIDDFGTGQASLAYLKSLPVDELKIDKSFVLNISNNRDDEIIVRSTIDLAHRMGLKVTAEGVEDEQAEALLKSFGCDVLQGYFYSKPVDAETLWQWIQEKLEFRTSCLVPVLVESVDEDEAHDEGSVNVAQA